MDRSQIAATAAALRRSFAAAGPDVVEKRMFGGHAYLVKDRIVGHIEERPDSLRVRLRLPDREQREIEARPTYDATGRWPALLIVSTDDVAFVERAVPAAYRHVSSGASAAPSAPAPTDVAKAPSPPTRPAGSEARSPGVGSPAAGARTAGKSGARRATTRRRA